VAATAPRAAADLRAQQDVEVEVNERGNVYVAVKRVNVRVEVKVSGTRVSPHFSTPQRR
jgi:hypothetical protein